MDTSSVGVLFLGGGVSLLPLFKTYYPLPLSPKPWAMITVDLCSVMAGNITGAGICENMEGSPTEEDIFRKACI